MCKAEVDYLLIAFKSLFMDIIIEVNFLLLEELSLFTGSILVSLSVLAEDAIKAALQDYKLKNQDSVKATA